ncbi:bifunctional diaminohydroxyphosphoribosylaminopyrimidine deaminase/5-amino-6-(5-phosphoribosylamino)uracil reductase RibD [Paenibacillus sp. J2TS4]|uniref:bifunctional diaminohydroxyphosphoribosylaminopyrimidine deaminase/5-amino-6-(5-phosphoribosylamino)uracil reductase RibD n=1 Tax=Paenibacillus sp. J2TS4 TaxID=2807194 RepID=UPI001BCD10F6|nr:bifunctional diaminohydroxyphosphoribosylaminopyrimidine deaminase/5-amino-6-(5-phosphoribosylamino)uracil reductase RibD [Paenibacillus sp. J2TS4]
MDLLNEEHYMRLALELARGTQGQTEINPVVGCVIVKDGRIVGMGAHLERGQAHAEVHALEMAGSQAEGSVAYVTLEPCSHYGRTPPCCDRLIEARVAKVVVASTDPNPQVAGSGIARLRSCGIQVEVGLCEQESRQLNEAFNKYIVTKQPFVTLKTASTLDGKIASRTGDSKWITNERSREYVHALRHRHQAIMVGVETVIADNPRLTTRLSVDAINPIRLVIDSNLRIPMDSLVLNQEAKTIIITTSAAPQEKREQLTKRGIEWVDAGSGPKVDLQLAMHKLGAKGISSILLEGGGRLNGAMLECGLIDKCILFYAPKIVGGPQAPNNFQFEGFDRMSDSVELDIVQVQQIEQDICMIGYPKYRGALSWRKGE